MAYSYVPSAKALAFGRDLTAALIQRGLAAVESFSAVSGVEGAPVVTVSGKALVRIEQAPTIQKDVLGLPQTVFTPHVAKCVLKSDAADVLATELSVLGEIAIRGVRIEVWTVTSSPAQSDISGDPDFTFDSIQYPLLATV